MAAKPEQLREWMAARRQQRTPTTSGSVAPRPAIPHSNNAPTPRPPSPPHVAGGVQDVLAPLPFPSLAPAAMPATPMVALSANSLPPRPISAPRARPPTAGTEGRSVPTFRGLSAQLPAQAALPPAPPRAVGSSVKEQAHAALLELELRDTKAAAEAAAVRAAGEAESLAADVVKLQSALAEEQAAVARYRAEVQVLRTNGVAEGAAAHSSRMDLAGRHERAAAEWRLERAALEASCATERTRAVAAEHRAEEVTRAKAASDAAAAAWRAAATAEHEVVRSRGLAAADRVAELDSALGREAAERAAAESRATVLALELAGMAAAQAAAVESAALARDGRTQAESARASAVAALEEARAQLDFTLDSQAEVTAELTAQADRCERGRLRAEESLRARDAALAIARSELAEERRRANGPDGVTTAGGPGADAAVREADAAARAAQEQLLATRAALGRMESQAKTLASQVQQLQQQLQQQQRQRAAPETSPTTAPPNTPVPLPLPFPPGPTPAEIDARVAAAATAAATAAAASSSLAREGDLAAARLEAEQAADALAMAHVTAAEKLATAMAAVEAAREDAALSDAAAAACRVALIDVKAKHATAVAAAAAACVEREAAVAALTAHTMSAKDDAAAAGAAADDRISALRAEIAALRLAEEEMAAVIESRTSAAAAAETRAHVAESALRASEERCVHLETALEVAGEQARAAGAAAVDARAGAETAARSLARLLADREGDAAAARVERDLWRRAAEEQHGGRERLVLLLQRLRAEGHASGLLPTPRATPPRTPVHGLVYAASGAEAPLTDAPPSATRSRRRKSAGTPHDENAAPRVNRTSPAAAIAFGSPLSSPAATKPAAKKVGGDHGAGPRKTLGTIQTAARSLGATRPAGRAPGQRWS